MNPKPESNYEWLHDVLPSIDNPDFADLFNRLVVEVNDQVESFREVDSTRHWKAVLEVCRLSQHIRMLVGDLSDLSPETLNLFRNALDASCKNRLSAEGRYTGREFKEFCAACKNIEYRLGLARNGDSSLPLLASR